MGSFSTQGWDTVFALRLAVVNAELARAVAQGSTRLPALDWESKDHYAALKATFDAWQVTGKGLEGSGGTVVTMRFPVRTGTFRVDKATQPIDGVTAVGTVNLIPLTDGPTHKLVVDSSRPIKITRIESAAPLQDKSSLQLAFTEALSAALPGFNHVFAAVDLNSRLKDALPWLAPKAAAFCFMGGDSDEESYFGTLCETDDYIPGNPLPPASMSGGLIPKGAAAALLVSKKLFFSQMLLPGLQKGFRSKGFRLTSGDSSIVKSEGSPELPIRTEPVDLSALYLLFADPAFRAILSPATVVEVLPALVLMAAEYATHGSVRIQGTMTINIDSLSITEEFGKIKAAAGLVCVVNTASPLPKVELLTARFDATTSFGLVVKPDGSIGFGPAGAPTHTTPQVEAASWIKNEVAVIEWFVDLVAMILTVVTEGLAFALVLVGEIIFNLLMKVVPELIAAYAGRHVGNAAPAALEAFAIAAVSPVTWTARSFRPTSVSLDGDLRFGGEFISS